MAKILPFPASGMLYAVAYHSGVGAVICRVSGRRGDIFFCRQALGAGFWPATVCAWCYPLTAFFVLWQGFPTGLGVYWLPWICWSVDKTIRSSSPWAVIALSIATFLTLTSGHLDVGVQVLLGSGIFALWSWWDTHRGEWFGRKSIRAARGLVFGWGLGFLLAVPPYSALV